MFTPEEWPPPFLEDWREQVRRDKSPEWLLAPFIPTAARVWVTGPPKLAKKTWFAFECVRALASGKQYGFFKPTHPEGINCLVIEKEGTPKFNEWRWGALAKGQGYEAPPGRVYMSYGSTMKLDNPKWRDRLTEFIAQKAIKFVVIDSLAKCMTGDENSAKDMGRVLDTIDDMRRLGATVMYLDHIHKIGGKEFEEDIDEQGRGSSAKAGYYDTHIAFRPEESGSEVVKQTVRNRDGAPEMFYRVVWSISKESGVAELHMEEFNPNAPISSDILAGCIEMMNKGVVYKMGALVQLWKLPRAMASRVLQELISGGLVTRTPSGFRREAI